MEGPFLMRVAGILMAVAVIAGSMASQAAPRVAFEDNKLNFKSCDGQNLTARWRDNNFHLSVPGKTLEPAAPELAYLSWDGGCRRMRVDSKGLFIHTHDGPSEASHLISYLGWDDSKWAATRAGTGFYQVFIAGNDEAISQEQMKDVAAWLATHKADSRAATLLAHELTAAAAP
jgi:hypothetical protein